MTPGAESRCQAPCLILQITGFTFPARLQSTPLHLITVVSFTLHGMTHPKRLCPAIFHRIGTLC